MALPSSWDQLFTVFQVKNGFIAVLEDGTTVVGNTLSEVCTNAGAESASRAAGMPAARPANRKKAANFDDDEEDPDEGIAKVVADWDKGPPPKPKFPIIR